MLAPPENSHVTVTFKSGITVSSMSAGSDVIIPARLASRRRQVRSKRFCTPAFRHLAHDHGVREPRLIDTLTNDASTTYVFAAVVDGSGECGAYGVWMMRVDKTIHITQPVEGCFAFSQDADPKSPVVAWGPPLRVVVQDEGSARTHAYVLDDEAFALKARRD